MSNVINMPYEWSPRKHQQELWDYMIQDADGLRAVQVAHRRFGKDSVAINIMATKAMQKPGLYYYMGPTQKHVRKIVWDNLGKDGKRIIDQAFPKCIRSDKGYSDQDMRIILLNGSIIQMLGSDNVDGIVGSNPSGMVFSEWSIAERPDSWDLFRPILKENGGWSMFIYTPRGLNHGYKTYRTAVSSPRWYASLLTIADTGMLTEQDMEEEREDGMSETKIRQEYYCDFIQDTEKQVFNIEAVIKAQKTEAPKDDPFAACIVGVDCARFGDDRSVIATRLGKDFKSIPAVVFVGKMDSIDLAQRVHEHAMKYKPDAIFIDETGQGGGVVDACIRIFRTPNVIGINFGSKALNRDMFYNIRAEMHSKFADWFLEPDVSFQDCSESLEEMSAITWKDVDLMGRQIVEKKEVIKKSTGVSPDLTDARILTFARPIMRKDVRKAMLDRKTGHNGPPRALMS